MTRTCLVSVYGNSNILAALSAVHWYSRECHGNEDFRAVTVVNTPGFSDTLLHESGATLTKITASLGWPSPIFLNDQDIAEILSPNQKRIAYRESLRRFRNKLGVEKIDEIYYAHDIGGQVPGLAMNAFPQAKRILFGDGLGSVYNKTYHMALVNGASIEQARQARRAKPQLPIRNLKRFIYEHLMNLVWGAPRPYQAEQAVLILPMDQTGDTLEKMQMFVVSKEMVQEIIATCIQNLTELSGYLRKLLASGPPPYVLLLLANMSDGNFTSLDNEVSLYEEIIRRHAPPKATVFIKGHPLSVAPVDELLCERLAAEYYPRVISRQFARYPIEFWSDLVRASTVISVAYSSISLAFLYDIQVIVAFNDDLIEKYIPKKLWGLYKDADHLYRGQLANLEQWDGKSILWKGSIQ